MSEINASEEIEDDALPRNEANNASEEPDSSSASPPLLHPVNTARRVVSSETNASEESGVDSLAMNETDNSGELSSHSSMPGLSEDDSSMPALVPPAAARRRGVVSLRRVPLPLMLAIAGGDDDDMSEDDSSEELPQLEDAPDPSASARDHAYLPGNSHPLYPEFLWEEQRQRSTSRSSTPRRLELAILELDGVVFFPGQRLPLRLRDPQWRAYLREQMNQNGGPQEQQQAVCIGVVTGKWRLETRRASWLRQAMYRRRSPFAEMLLEGMPTVGRFEALVENEPHPLGRFAMPFEPPGRANAPENQEDPLIGKIGTMALISYTYEITGLAATDVGDRFGLIRGQLIVTAFGTTRFRILSRSTETRRGIPAPYMGVGDTAGVRLYRCEELPEETFSLPPLPRHVHRALHEHSDIVRDASAQTYFDQHDQTLRHLSQVTPLPYAIYKSYWPWRLVGLIRSALDRVQSFEGLRQNLPPLDDRSAESMYRLDPVSFSFWMASNMSLKEEEKLEVLRMQCPLQRLRYIYEKVLAQERTEQVVCCRMCLTQVSRASGLFTVGGADGTTGAYVNEHGVVHQTVTLRSVDEEMFVYTGRPETRDSWFPGYSWTIASCRACNCHLGWKFRRVTGSTRYEDDSTNEGESSRDDSSDRPKEFWGLSGASITIAAEDNHDNDTT